jgi:hypothetical protein
MARMNNVEKREVVTKEENVEQYNERKINKLNNINFNEKIKVNLNKTNPLSLLKMVYENKMDDENFIISFGYGDNINKIYTLNEKLLTRIEEQSYANDLTMGSDT